MHNEDMEYYVILFFPPTDEKTCFLVMEQKKLLDMALMKVHLVIIKISFPHRSISFFSEIMVSQPWHN